MSICHFITWLINPFEVVSIQKRKIIVEFEIQHLFNGVELNPTYLTKYLLILVDFIGLVRNILEGKSQTASEISHELQYFPVYLSVLFDLHRVCL